MLFTRQRLSVRSMEDIILSIHRKTAMNFAMQQVRTTMDLTILAEPLFPMEMWDTTEEGENRTNQTANDHGSLACIKGQWYIFHHRQTHSGTFSRQACAEPVRIAEDGSIAQVECTSMGFHRGALETKGSYPAIISCVLTNGAMPHITNTLIQEDIIFSARPKM